MMQAKFVYESIKHLKPRSAEEIEAIKRTELEEYLSFIKEPDVKEDIIQLKFALEKVLINLWVHFGERSKDYELRPDNINDNVVIENEAYKSVNIYYITEETIEIYKAFFDRVGLKDITPCFGISDWDGKMLLHTTDWHEVYQFIIEKKKCILR